MKTCLLHYLIEIIEGEIWRHTLTFRDLFDITQLSKTNAISYFNYYAPFGSREFVKKENARREKRIENVP